MLQERENGSIRNILRACTRFLLSTIRESDIIASLFLINFHITMFTQMSLEISLNRKSLYHVYVFFLCVCGVFKYINKIFLVNKKQKTFQFPYVIFFLPISSSMVASLRDCLPSIFAPCSQCARLTGYSLAPSS